MEKSSGIDCIFEGAFVLKFNGKFNFIENIYDIWNDCKSELFM